MLALLPGLGVSLALAWFAVQASLLFGNPSPVSPITLAILLGILIGNTVGVPKNLAAGLDFSTKKLLRLGIILIGLKLSLQEVYEKGLIAVPVVMIVIAGGLWFTSLASRWMGVTRGLALVTAAATSICGVTAAVSVAPVVEATEEELSYAVANVTLYGLLGMILYPSLAHFVFGTKSVAAGLFLGTAIHDTSQVVAAAASYENLFHDPAVLGFATLTKLTRNVFLVVVVPLLAYMHARETGTERKQLKLSTLFPTFVLAFLALVVVRTAGDRYWPSKEWAYNCKVVTDTVAPFLLAAALGSVGLTTQLARLKKLGLKPLYVGGAAATCVGVLGMGLAAIAAQFSK